MSETKWTKGPWKVNNTNRDKWPSGLIIVGYGSNVLAVVHDTGNPVVVEQGAANARLIVASPMMFEALRQIADPAKGAWDTDFQAIARAALAKIEGK
jgi:hypothetical protein